ncbi:MAG: hypothetical protein RIB84_08895 [Sneathiellaceae bacterium]
MKINFTAKPPLPAWKGRYGGIGKHVGKLIRNFFFVIWYAIIPFNFRPEENEILSDTTGDIDDGQINLCQSMFDQTEERRNKLEQKAQWTFALIIFLVPIFVSMFFYVYKDMLYDARIRYFSLVFLSISGGLLFLGFISVVRAVSVQAREILFIGALIDLDKQQFRTYSKIFHAKGLLYCVIMNTAMNDHIAQFVKGAHILTASAVIFLLVAAVPAGIAFTEPAFSQVQTRILGPVSISFPDPGLLRDKVRGAQDLIPTAKIDDAATGEIIKSLEEKIVDLERKIDEIKNKMAGEKGANITVP